MSEVVGKVEDYVVVPLRWHTDESWITVVDGAWRYGDGEIH
jgi:hypothetical protein